MTSRGRTYKSHNPALAEFREMERPTNVLYVRTSNEAIFRWHVPFLKHGRTSRPETAESKSWSLSLLCARPWLVSGANRATISRR